MKKNSYYIILIALIIVLAFYGGTKYGQSKTSTNSQNGQGNFQVMGNGQRAGGVRFSGAGLVNGQITSLDNQSLTIKSSDGNSKVVIYSPTTEISKFASGTLTDLVAGKTVMVTGKTNSDGSVTAQSIQVRPDNQNFGPGMSSSTRPNGPQQ